MSDGRDLARAAAVLIAIELRMRKEQTDADDIERIDGDGCIRPGID